LHEIGLRQALKMLPMDKQPHVVVFGIEPERIDYGMELSPRVKAALPELVKIVRQKAAQYLDS